MAKNKRFVKNNNIAVCNKKISDFFKKVDIPTEIAATVDASIIKSEKENLIKLEIEEEEIIFVPSSPTAVSPRPSTSNKTTQTPESSPVLKKRRLSKISPRIGRKLFEKSPAKIKSYNVNVIEKFVSVTPVKNGEGTRIVEDNSKSSEKKQLSMFRFVSPLKSNETTPKKTLKSQNCSSVSKVKTKLNFSDNENLNTAFEGVDFDDGWEENSELNSIEDELDLSISQLCIVESIDVQNKTTVLLLKSTTSNKKAFCRLEGIWTNLRVSVDDQVRIVAQKESNNWIINSQQGLLVIEPDRLISSTAVAGSLWCKRRSILQEKFRSFNGPNNHMIIGSLTHVLFQFALKNKITDLKKLQLHAEELITQQKTVSDLYDAGLTIAEVKTELLNYVPKICIFMKSYVASCNKNATENFDYPKGNWKGIIQTIDDIEENIWCPELGLKGKIDVTIKSDTAQTMPLELKTGRATVSLEHRAQVIMYLVMMNKLGYSASSGLLLYLKEGVLKEVALSPREQRDITMLRNELAYYLSRKVKIENQKMYPPELPPVINHSSCSKCPYNVICTSYARYNEEDLGSNVALKEVQETTLETLKDSHLNYIMKWVVLTSLECNSSKADSKNLTDIFNVAPENRIKCISNVRITSVTPLPNDIFEHTFTKLDPKCSVNFYTNGLFEGNYVIVSTTKRTSISSGYVTNIATATVTVTLDKNLKEKYSKEIFHIDGYDTNLECYNLAGLSLLFEITPRAEQLRRLIIDKASPTFKESSPRKIWIKDNESILKTLNVVQQNALIRAVSAEDYFLIKGMPGTGKTSMIIALIRILYKMGKNVLISSHTHSAIDNICVKLLQFNVKLMRLGSATKIKELILPYSEMALTKHCMTPEELESVYNNQKIVAVTCMGSSHPLLTKRTFDICIVDESTQVIQTTVIRPIYAAKTFILIGDPDQLSPVITNKTAREMGMSESLFTRLYDKKCSAVLNLNYRMNKVITKLANALTYKGELRSANEEVGSATVKFAQTEVLDNLSSEFDWIKFALDHQLKHSVKIIDTGAIWNLPQNSLLQRNSSHSSSNVYEAAIVFLLVQNLLKLGVSASDIGVIATYRAQVADISSMLKSKNVDVSTVDQFQGQDKSVIIYSCSKSKDVTQHANNDFSDELLEDKQRINVAITRAKHKLIIIGDVNTLMLYAPFKIILKACKDHVIKLKECEGFKWESILSAAHIDNK